MGLEIANHDFQGALYYLLPISAFFLGIVISEFIKHKTVEFGGNPFVIYLLNDTETYKYSIEMLNLKDNSKFTLYEFAFVRLHTRKKNILLV